MKCFTEIYLRDKKCQSRINDQKKMSIKISRVHRAAVCIVLFNLTERIAFGNPLGTLLR